MDKATLKRKPLVPYEQHCWARRLESLFEELKAQENVHVIIRMRAGRPFNISFENPYGTCQKKLKSHKEALLLSIMEVVNKLQSKNVVNGILMLSVFTTNLYDGNNPIRKAQIFGYQSKSAMKASDYLAKKELLI